MNYYSLSKITNQKEICKAILIPHKLFLLLYVIFLIEFTFISFTYFSPYNEVENLELIDTSYINTNIYKGN